ncbi:MAG: SOS response-associated peptidase, partial [Gaiellaceae bacterium]
GVLQRYNVAPAQNVLTVRALEGERVAELMRWGLVPHWAKDPSVSYKMINARAETVAEKPVYKKLLESKRCLIPADGFYEWTTAPDGKKVPIRFTLSDEELFAFAGLWTSWVNKESGELLDSCTIVTTTPNDLVAHTHNRMPVILPVDAEGRWVDPELSVEDARALLRPYPAKAMLARVASRRVNRAGPDDAELFAPDEGDEDLLNTLLVA